MLAASEGHQSVVNVLLAAKADKDKQDRVSTLIIHVLIYVLFIIMSNAFLFVYNIIKSLHFENK